MIKEMGVDIIGPDWHYLNSPFRHSQDYEEIETELYSIAFMHKNKPITSDFHDAGILVHPYTVKDDFLRYSSVSPIDELDYYFNVLKLDGVFTESPKTAMMAW